MTPPTPLPHAGLSAPGRAALMRAMELNLAAHAALLHPFVAGAAVERIGDFQLSDSGLAHDTYNIVSRVRFDRGFAAEDVSAVAADARATGRPFSWWVADEDALAEAAPALAAAGFEAGETEEAMALALDDLILPSRSATADVRRVRTAEDLAGYAAVLAANWDPPATEVERFLTLAGAGAGALWDEVPGSRFFVAVIDGAPVAGAEVLIAAGVAGIYGVATLEAHRGRGLATGILTAALRELREEEAVTHAVLQATADGGSLYRRLGFRPMGACTEFALAPAGDQAAGAADGAGAL